MIVDLVSQFIEETRGHPLDVTVPEAQLLHDFATWVDNQSAQQGVQAELLTTVYSDGAAQMEINKKPTPYIKPQSA